MAFLVRPNFAVVLSPPPTNAALIHPIRPISLLSPPSSLHRRSLSVSPLFTVRAFSAPVTPSQGIKVKSLPTKPIGGQKTGTSGFRKKVKVFMQENYLANWIQAFFNSLPPEDYKNGVLVLGDMTSSGRRRIIFAGTLTYILHFFESSRRFPADATEDYILLKEEVKKVLSKAKAAGVLRLAFHDAGTFEMDGTPGGINGSIIYELDRPENAGLRKPIKILEKAKSAMDAMRPVSWADVIAVGGAEAVSLCGGPLIPVRLGRTDSRVPDAEGKLPQETLDASSLKQCFQRKGFTTQELVALSGAHTLGGKGFGSPITFDNSYYKILLEKPWLSSAGMSTMIGLPSDHALVEDDECLRWVLAYAEDQSLFFEDFKKAYIKLVNCGARWKMSS